MRKFSYMLTDQWKKLIPSNPVQTFSILFLFSFLFFSSKTFAQVGPGFVNVNPPTGGFRIEGNLQANAPTVGEGDWLPGPAGAGGNVLTAGGAPLVAATTYHLTDLYSSGADNNFSGGLKFDGNPNGWTWVSNPVGAKVDINNALIHFAKDVSGNVWVIFAADRSSNNGDAYIDFEFLQNTLSTTGATSGGFSSAGTNGGRTGNDFVVTLALTKGGSSAGFFVERWQTVPVSAQAPAGYDYVDRTASIPAGSTFAAVNTTSVPVSFGAFGGTSYATNTFVEAAVNLTALLGAFDPCTELGIKTILVKTKESQSPTATIVDFITPQQVALTLGVANAGDDQTKCSGGASTSFTVTGTATPSPGDVVSSTTWSVAAGSGTATISSPNSLSTSVQVTSSSVKLVFTVMTNPHGCIVRDTLQLNVTPSDPTTANVIQPTCTVATGTITVTAPTGAGTTYSIDGTNFQSSATFSGLAPNSYTITSKTSSGCVSSISKTVNPQPPTPAAPTAHVDQPTCTVATATITITSSTSGLTFSLDGGAYAAYPAGGYTVAANSSHTLRAKNSDGCISDITNVTVNAQPPTPAAPITHVDQPTCAIATGTITITSSTAGLTFSLDGGAYAAYPSGGYTVAANSSHTLRAKNSDGCISDITNVTVNEQPVAPTPPDATYNAPKCDEKTFSVTISKVVSGAKYYIVDKNSNAIPGVTPASGYTAPDNNDFLFSNIPAGSGFIVTVVGANGCAPENSPLICGTPGVTTRKTTSSTTELTSSQTSVKAYPNPFSDRVKFVVTSPVAGRGNLEVYNMMGHKVKTVYQGFISAGTQTFEMSLPTQQIANLVYVLRIGDKKMSGKILQINQ